MIGMVKALLLGLSALALPLVRRVLVGLGFGVVSYAGLYTLFDTIIDEITVAYSGFPTDALSVLNMAGMNIYFSIVLSAIVSRFAVLGLYRFAFRGPPV